MPVAWLEDGSEASLRAALARAVPELAHLPVTMSSRHAASNPRWWASSALIDGRFVVKFAWSEIRARRLWREGVVLERLAARRPALPVPDLVALHRDPVLVVTRMVTGVPLGWNWAQGITDAARAEVAQQLAAFLGRLHGTDAAPVVAGLDVVRPSPQGDTGQLRSRFPALLDERRGASVQRWCDWVDDVLAVDGPSAFVHGDLHGYNQIWDPGTPTLLAVVDFEECGVTDPHYDLRYLPAYAAGVDLVLAVMDAYATITGRRLAVTRVMAWHVLTALGDALWRTDAELALPGGGTPTTYVDGLARAFDVLGINP